MAVSTTRNTDRINYLNIGLMAVSCAVALVIPFELFLFAYAILGPAHYLTEISWLQKRKFFTQGKYDFWLLGALAALGGYSFVSSSWNATWTLLALGCALVFLLTGKIAPRILGLIPVLVLAAIVVNTSGFLIVAFALFVPTLVHVYIFTGIFMLYGALKERSRTGYLAFGCFLLCPLAFVMVHPDAHAPARQAMISFWNNFSTLNLTLLGLDLPRTTAEARAAFEAVFASRTGLTVMRFVAFAYTYHYLNWFSKTSIIKWHEVSRVRIGVLAALWAGSVGLYLYNFSLGFKYLFFLSLTHVYLEFPLNHLSIMGTYREVRGRFGGSAAPVAVGKRRRATA